MKIVILCGGRGSRLSEETTVKPKPMVTVGESPILLHIMQRYAKFGFNEFVLALGYKGDVIKDYFIKFCQFNNDIQIDLKAGSVKQLTFESMDWKIDFIHTGNETLTGGRLHRLRDHLKNAGTFCLTYGDGVADINLKDLVQFHQKHGKMGTVTAVRPPARFGEMILEKDQIVNFAEKPQASQGWINGGFFVFEPAIFDYLADDQTVLEGYPLETLAKEGQLMAFKHTGFWQCMDTVRDRDYLNGLIDAQGRAPWL